jgi:hypothetical protein
LKNPAVLDEPEIIDRLPDPKYNKKDPDILL